MEITHISLASLCHRCHQRFLAFASNLVDSYPLFYIIFVMDDTVIDLALSLTKTVKAAQMYSTSHPSFMNFFTPLFEKMTSFLESAQQLVFQIEKFTILHNNQTVYEETEKDASIAFRLFRDGIREMSFSVGLTEEELMIFLETVSHVSKEHDIALDLWECDFAHIGFYVVEEEEEIITYKIPETKRQEIDYDQKAREISDKEKLNVTMSISPDLNPGELEELKIDIAENEKMQVLPTAITTLINILEIDKSQHVLNSLGELLELCINATDFYNARRIVHKVTNIPGVNLMEKFETEAVITGFASLPNTLEEKSFNEFVAFIGFFSKRTVPFFMKILNKTRRKERLEVIRQRLAYICQDDAALILPFLKSENITTLVNAIAILADMHLREIASHLEPLYIHQEFEVRTAVVEALAAIGNTKAIAGFLDDPSSNVRVKALQSLSRNRYLKIYPKLLKRIKQKDFLSIDFSEQREFFNALVANGERKLAHDLGKILFKWVLFNRKKYAVKRKLAAQALAQIYSEEAFKLLQKGMSKKNKDIRVACEMVIGKK